MSSRRRSTRPSVYSTRQAPSVKAQWPVARHLLSAGSKWRVRSLVQELDGAVDTGKGRRRVAGVAVGNVMGVQLTNTLATVVFSAPMTEQEYSSRISRARAGPRAKRQAAREAGTERTAQLPHDAGREQPVTDHVAHGNSRRSSRSSTRSYQSPPTCSAPGRAIRSATATDWRPTGRGAGQHRLCKLSATTRGADEFGDLLHPMQQPDYPPVRTEDGNVDHAPVALLSPRRGLGSAGRSVAAHGVAPRPVSTPGKRCLDFAHHSYRDGEGAATGESVWKEATDDLLASTSRDAQPFLVDVLIDQLRGQQRHCSGKCLEHRRVVDLRFRHVCSASPHCCLFSR